MGTIQCAAVMLLVMLDFAQAAFFKCAFDDRDLKRCAEPEAYHCQNLGETEHALHGCAVPKECQPGERAELSGTNEDLKVKCVPCGDLEYQPYSVWSNKPRSTECFKHTHCNHSRVIVYQKGNLTNDILCKCNVEEGFYLPKYLVRESPIKYTCSEPNCHCKKKLCPAGKQLEESGDCELCPPGTEKPEESHAQCQSTNVTLQPSPTGHAGVTTTRGDTEGVPPGNTTTHDLPNKSLPDWEIALILGICTFAGILALGICYCQKKHLCCWKRENKGGSSTGVNPVITCLRRNICCCKTTSPDAGVMSPLTEIEMRSLNGQSDMPNGAIPQGNEDPPASQPLLPQGGHPPVDDSRADSQMLDLEILPRTPRQEEHPVMTSNQSHGEEPNSYAQPTEEEELDLLTPPNGEGPNPDEEEEHDQPTCTPPPEEELNSQPQPAPPVVSSTRVQDSTGVTVNNFYAQVFVTNTSGPVIRNPNGSGNGNAANNCPPSGPSTNVGGIQPASSNVPATTNNRDTQPASSNGAPSTNIGRVQPASNNDFRTINSDTDSAQPIRNNGTAINGQEGQNSNLRLGNIEPLTMDTGASDSLPPRPVPEERSDLSSETVPKERYSSPEQLSQTTPKVLYTKSEQGSASS